MISKRFRRAAALFLLLVMTFSFSDSLAATKKAKATPNPDAIIEPTLPPDAPPYDPERPEDLVEEQLYGLSEILITQDTGEVIFEKDAHSIRYPASTTKILTCLLGIINVDDLDQIVTVSETAMNIPSDSSTMGLHVGEQIRFIDVLYGTMMLSGNDGANVIAETVAGSVDAFVYMMNEAAAVCGCHSTHFANPHGYHDDNHYSTAYDMALIARWAMENDTFRAIANTTSYSIPKTNMSRARTIETRHEILKPGTEEKPNKYYYQYANGIKTGSHSKAAYCFVGSATKDDVDLISVVFYAGKRGQWADTIKLFNYGFSQYVSASPPDIYAMNPVTIFTSNYSLQDPAMGKLELLCSPFSTKGTSASMTITKARMEEMAANLQDEFLIEYTRDFIAPIQAGEPVGTLTWFPEGKESVTFTLTASRTVERRENIPKTLDEIVAMTDAQIAAGNLLPDSPNARAELLITVLVILLLMAGIILLFRKLIKKLRRANSKIPKPTRRYLK